MVDKFLPLNSFYFFLYYAFSVVKHCEIGPTSTAFFLLDDLTSQTRFGLTKIMAGRSALWPSSLILFTLNGSYGKHVHRYVLYLLFL